MGFIARYLLGKAKNATKAFARVAGGFAAAGLATLYLDQNIAGARIAEGPSMSPLLNKIEYTEAKFADIEHPNRDSQNRNDLVILIRKFELERGDVVVLEDPKRKYNTLIKRVVALEGDQIVPLGFNDVLLEPVTLQEGEAWVESDAGGFRWRDSHMFGPIRVETIEGKAIFATSTFPLSWLTETRRIVSEVPESAQARLTVAHHG